MSSNLHARRKPSQNQHHHQHDAEEGLTGTLNVNTTINNTSSNHNHSSIGNSSSHHSHSLHHSSSHNNSNNNNSHIHQHEPSPASSKGFNKKQRVLHRLHLSSVTNSSYACRQICQNVTYVMLLLLALMAFAFSLAYFLLHHQHRQVIVHISTIINDPWNHGKAALVGRTGFKHHFYTGSPRYVTIVMPSVVNPTHRTDRLLAIQDTWGPGSRAIFVVHNVTEFPNAQHALLSAEHKPEDPYSYPQLLLLPPDMDFNDGLPRLYYTIRIIHKSVDPDFAFFANDHTFVLPEHLCKFLENKDPEEDLYAGHAMKTGPNNQVFNSGAAGYLLSRATMAKMVEIWDKHDQQLQQHAQNIVDDYPECILDLNNTTPWIQGNPGLATVNCLESFGVRAYDTRSSGKWHRFHAFPITRVVSGHLDDWYAKKHLGAGERLGVDSSYDTLLNGPDCCSSDTISFHYVERQECLALFSVREELLRHPHMSDKELKHLIEKEWPTDRKVIGFYSHPLPKEDETDLWASFLKVIRKISTRATQHDC